MTSSLLINQLNALNPILKGISLIVAEYLPFLFICWLIYIWIKKYDVYLDIVLYCIYAALLGIFINYLTGIVYSAASGTNSIIFMLSVSLMLACFMETRKSGIILIILALFGSMLSVLSALVIPLDILTSGLIAMVSTAIIYYLRDSLIGVNQIFKAMYYVLK